MVAGIEPADLLIRRIEVQGAHCFHKSLIAFNALQIIGLKDAADGNVSPFSQMPDKHSASAGVVVFYIQAVLQCRIIIMEKHNRSPFFDETAVQIEIRAGKSAFASFCNDSEGRSIEQAEQDLILGLCPVPGNMHAAGKSVLVQFRADIRKNARVDILLIIGDQDGYRIAGRIRRKSRYVRTAPLSSHDEPAVLQDGQRLPYGLAAYMISGTQFLFRGQFLYSGVPVFLCHLFQLSGEPFVLDRHGKILL